MAPAEYVGWERHLKKYPPGDYLTQLLLAQVLMAFVGFASGKTLKLSEVAPWLEAWDPEKETAKGKEAADKGVSKRMKHIKLVQDMMRRKNA